MADSVALSQEELDRVLHNVRNDNNERESKPVSSGVSLSQSELDKLFGSGATATVRTAMPEAAPGQPPSAPEDAEAVRQAKIAERKARAAEMLARVNAGSPKRISVIYGSTLKKGDEISALAAGDTIILDRATEEAAEIQVDGKPFAYGTVGNVSGSAAIKITRLL